MSIYFSVITVEENHFFGVNAAILKSIEAYIVNESSNGVVSEITES